MTDKFEKSRIFSPSLLSEELAEELRKIIATLQEIELTRRDDFLIKRMIPDPGSIDEQRFNVCLSLLADLAEQGWSIVVEKGEMVVAPPPFGAKSGESIDAMKRRARQGLQRASNRQLAEKSVENFLKDMEKRREYGGAEISVSSLIDNGSELAEKFSQLRLLDAPQRVKKISKIIRPVVQECITGARCEFTGLRLQDIWRYFRHTWSLEYNPLPGRTLRLLVRNSARPNWPVIGIAMLASPSANMYVRDSWLGWRGPDDVIDGILSERWDPSFVGSAIVRAVETAIRDIRTDDLLTPEEIKAPTSQALFRLEQLLIRSTARRGEDLTSGTNGIVDIRGFKKGPIGDDHWRTLSETSLFLKKRCEALIPLLKAIQYFHDSDFYTVPGAAVMEALTSKRGREVIAVALGEIKKARSASEIADVAVCGAISPYNELLGGKLVTLLMGSRETRDIYAARYDNQVSEIASQLAGRPIVRSADLKVLTTTSLYGVGANQYTRTKITPADHPKLKANVKWDYLDTTSGFTVTHVSRRTVKLMRDLAIEAYGRRRINSVFGEGSSPRTRQIREGLNLIGVNNDDLLRQSVGRRVYAFEFFDSAREALLGFKRNVKSKQSAPTSVIAEAWISRWVSKRIIREDVLARLLVSGPDQLIANLNARAIEGRFDDLANGYDT